MKCVRMPPRSGFLWGLFLGTTKCTLGRREDLELQAESPHLRVGFVGTEMRRRGEVGEVGFLDAPRARQYDPGWGRADSREHFAVRQVFLFWCPSPIGRGPLLALFAFMVGATQSAGQQLTPQSPEVQRVVGQAIKFLETSHDPRIGGRALVGLAMVKAGQRDHPRVREFAKEVQALSGRPAGNDVYTASIALVFLVELNPKTYRSEIEALLKYLLTIQKPQGGWGYLDRTTGDTSMTQNAVLAMWVAHQAKFSTPVESVERVMNWLLRTQDPSGAFGYQGNDPGSFNLVAQDSPRLSLAAAGLGSLYLCADRLALRIGAPRDEELPAALKPVTADKSPPVTARIDRKILEAALVRGNRWMRENYRINPEEYGSYYLYALERYQSVLSVMAPDQAADAPDWYADGVKFLTKVQSPSGAFLLPSSELGAVTDTAFSILFLMRSFQQNLKRPSLLLGAGVLVGGRGLPANADEIEMRMGRVTAKPLAGPAESLIGMLEDPLRNNYLGAVEGLREASFEELFRDADQQNRSAAVRRLEALAGSDRPEAKAVALRLLSRSRDLDQVPLLIEALADPNPEVWHEARAGLCFMSRKFAGVVKQLDADDHPGATEIAGWKAWYLSLRPEAEFEK